MPTPVDALITAFRDFIVDGLPSSGPNKPSKSEIRAGLLTLAAALASLGSDFTSLPTQLTADNVTYVPAQMSDGSQKRISIGALQQVFGQVIDPSKPPYNVKYDVQRVKAEASITSGTNTVQMVHDVFVAGRDEGKLFAMGGAVGGGTGALVAYIGTVVDTKHATLVTTPGGSTPANASVTVSSQDAFWGTDSTTGLQQALDDADPTAPYARGKTVLIAGICMSRKIRFGSISIIGFSAMTCGFVMAPFANNNDAGTGDDPFVADKVTGAYASTRAQYYEISNIGIWGMKYAQPYTSFRRLFHIRGGLFSQFTDGAPYPRLADIETNESNWDGIAITSPVFGGHAYGLRAFWNNQIGIRCHASDLQFGGWHVEANGYCGVLSAMSGSTGDNIKCSYNGGSAFGTYIYEYGANWCEVGINNTVSLIRVQESWGPNILISNKDPLSIALAGGGHGNQFHDVKLDDTGNQGTYHGNRPASLPPVRAIVMCKGATVKDNIVRLALAAPTIPIGTTTNYATHGYFDMGDAAGNPSGNTIIIDTTSLITSSTSDWYNGGATTLGTSYTVPAGTGDYVRGPWGTTCRVDNTDSGSAIVSVGSRNTVTVAGTNAT